MNDDQSEADSVEVKDRFARLNKNFVNQNEGLGQIVERVNGRDLFWLFAFLAEAQKNRNREVRFASEYTALKEFGIRITTRERRALRRALGLWRSIGFEFKSWFHDEESQPLDGMVMERKAKVRLKRKRKKEQHRPRSFRRVWSVRRGNDNSFTIIFRKDFYKANTHPGYWLHAWLNATRQLRYPHVIVLALLIDAMPVIRWTPAHLGEKIGLRDEKPARRMASLKKAVEAIEEATGWVINLQVLDSGLVLIERFRDYGLSALEDERQRHRSAKAASTHHPDFVEKVEKLRRSMSKRSGD